MNVRALAHQLHHFDARGLHENLVKLDLGRAPASHLEQLWERSASLRAIIPELSCYDIGTIDGRIEFPRTMAALAAVGVMMRAALALELLDRPVLRAEDRRQASQTVTEEFENFAIHSHERTGMTFEQFQRFARLFAPLNTNHDLLTLVCLEVIYGDMAKLASIREVLGKNLAIDTSDHDLALTTALRHPDFKTVASLFPTVNTLSPETFTTLLGNLAHGFNIGAMLQIEVPAAVSRPLAEISKENTEAIQTWFLASLADIFGARAVANDPKSWHTSPLVTVTLAEDLLTVAPHLATLSADSTGVEFFESLHAALYERSYYQPIRDAAKLSEDERRTIYRLSRFLSFQTDARPIDTLIKHWSALSTEQRTRLTEFFDNPGLNPETPRPSITYIPYLFNRMYVRHFPLNEALDRFLNDITDLFARLEATGSATRWAREESDGGYYTASCQDTWRHSLQHLGRDELIRRDPHLVVSLTEKGKAEVVLHDEILLKNDLLRVRLLNALQEASKSAEKECKTLLTQRLNSTERELLDWVNYLPFIDGSWYRPIHNLVVPMAMTRICRESKAPRILVIPAIVHDVGYTAYEVPGTLQGAGWASTPMREGHQLASKEMSKPILNRLREEGKLTIPDDTLEHILEIIATHDNPYIGIPLTDHLAKLHRDADRSFVISCVSFWKDYLAYISDAKRMQKFAADGVRLSPDTFLRLREASFEYDPGSPLEKHTSFEPMTSGTAQRIFQMQRGMRREEFAQVLELLSRGDEAADRELTEYLQEQIVCEFRALE
jgi:hypothetical protein